MDRPTAAGVALGWLIASSLAGGFGLERQSLGPLLQQVLVGAAIVVFLRILRRRRAARVQPAPKTLATPSVAAKPAPLLAAPGEHPGRDWSLDQGLRDIRRADPKFDPPQIHRLHRDGVPEHPQRADQPGRRLPP